MTQEQTRQLGIEFERRINLIYPQSELLDKLTSSVIYSVLNEYQLKYLKQFLMQNDQVQNDTVGASKYNQIMKTFTKHYRTDSIPYDSVQDDSLEPNCRVMELPEDILHYLRSFSYIDCWYKQPDEDTQKHSCVPNVLIKSSDVNKFMESPYNKGAIIRKPFVTLEEYIDNRQNKLYLKVFTDTYTSVDAVDITYCRIPYQFNILGFDDSDLSVGAVHSSCELPFDCFDELVDGAIQLYITNYKFYLQLASNDRTRRSVEKAIGEMSDANKENRK